jgi:L-amino acid N-acyltransferase YncA
MAFDEYPKEIALKNGVNCVVRLMTSRDHDALYRYFIQLPFEDRSYLRNNITDRILIERWCREINYEKTLPMVTENNGRIVSVATIHREPHGWGRHIGELRVTIDRDFRQQGLGAILNEEITHLARRMNLELLCARVVASRDYVIKAAENNGFRQVAVLKKFVKNIHDQSYEDVAILVKELTAGFPGSAEAIPGGYRGADKH